MKRSTHIGRRLWIVPLAAGLLIPAARVLAIDYETYGVHRAPLHPCAAPATLGCVYVRGTGEPTDPAYPKYWSSKWTMYVVSHRHDQYPPPYDPAPPPQLKEHTDYEKSYGASYYDSTWTGPPGWPGNGAMMEHYEKQCLPVFKPPTNFTCTIISLGDITFFIQYANGRPCLFKRDFHSPQTDFIKHLPYSPKDGAQLNNRVQGYSFWVSSQDSSVIQVGASPEPDPKYKGLLFGYAFMSKATKDRVLRSAKAYRHPQSFYFSGYADPSAATAPIISQNYTNFAIVKPDPKETWDLISTTEIPQQCPQKFFPITPLSERWPSWGDLKSH
jgi:hypothetical protein